MLQNVKRIFALLSLLTLSACGGGGSSSGSDGDALKTTASFSVELSGIEIQRVSSGELISVDISSVKSEDLIYTK